MEHLETSEITIMNISTNIQQSAYAAQGFGVQNLFTGSVVTSTTFVKPGQYSPSSQTTNNPDSVAETFSQEILRRLEAQEADELSMEVGEEDGEAKDPARLAESLTDTLEYIESEFGRDAATAAMGVILQKTSSGLTEDSLSQGLLNVVKLVDSNYGFAAGDQVINKLNGELNSALNDYFDNGYNETFFAAPVGTSGVLDSLNSALSELAAGSGENASDSLLAMLRQSDGDTSLRETISSWLDGLRDQYGDDAVDAASGILSQGLTGSALSGQVRTGALLDVTI